MPDDPPTPAPGEPPKPPPKNPRPPAPGWMWAVFGLALVPVGALICALNLPSNPQEMAVAILAGAFGGLLLGLPMLGGLAIAVRFFDDSAARLIGGVVFGVAIIALLAGVVFAGCVCLFQGTTFR